MNGDGMESSSGWLTPAEVAAYFQVSPITVRSWAQKGLLKASVTPGGHRRFRLADVEQLAAQRLKGNSPVTEQQKTILIVDDDEAVAELLMSALEFKYPEINVVAVNNGFEAGALVAEVLPDLIFLDIRMPGIQGDAVCNYLKSNIRTRHIPIAAITGYASPENLQTMIDAGVTTVLTKPFNLGLVFAEVEKIQEPAYA